MNELDRKLLFHKFARSGDLRGIDRLLAENPAIPRGVLSLAADNGQVEIVEKLLSAGNYSGAPLEELSSALCDAAHDRHKEMVRLLLDAGASPDAGTGEFLSVPVLLIAARGGMTELVKELLKRGATPNTHDIPASAELLGCNINETALMAAAAGGYIEIVRLLLSAGADPHLKGIARKTAYDLVSKKKGREAIAELLREWMRKHPAGSEPARVTANPVALAPFTSWEHAMQCIASVTAAKPQADASIKAMVRFPLSLEAAQRMTAGGQRKKQKPLETYRAALGTVQRLSEGVPACWFLQCEPVGGVFLCAVPKADKWKVITGFRTACVNYGVSHNALVKFLRVVDAQAPFELVECDESSVSGRFVKPPTKTRAVAEKLVEFCPFAADDHGGKVREFAHALAKQRHFKIWWD